MFHSEQDFTFNFKQIFSHLTTKKAILIIVILGFIVFGNALFNGFVWDDFPFIVDNTQIHTIAIAQIFGRNLFNTAGYYRPIPALYFELLYIIFGATPFYFHVFQVTLHIVNTSILYLIFRSLFTQFGAKGTADPKGTEDKGWENLSSRQKKKQRKMQKQIQVQALKTTNIPNRTTDVISLFLSLIFLVHPINVESVSYIAASQSELFFLFGSLALFISVKNKVSLTDLILLSALLLLSLLTKEVGVLFLLMILLFQFLFNRRRLYTVFQFELATLLIYFFIRFAIGGVYFSKVVLVAPIPLANLPFIERLANIPAIVWYYLTTTFFPLRLAINQLWIVTELTGQDFYLPLLLDSLFFLALCMAGVYLYIHKKSYFKPYLFFLLWFLFGIGMLLQIFPLDMTVSDRWFYFPIVGLLGIIGVGIQMMLKKHGSYSFINHEKTKLVTALFGAVLILLLSVRTIGRNNDYHDDITLVTQASHIQDNYLIEDTLGVEYAKAGNTKEALPHLQHSVSLYPYATNLYHLGLFYETSGNMPKTIEYYNKAVTAAETSDPTAYAHSLVDYQLYERVARLLLLSHKYQAAEKISKNGLLSHSTSLLWLEFALSENKLHRWKEAFEAVMQTNPTSASSILYSSIENKQEMPTDTIPLILNQYSVFRL